MMFMSNPAPFVILGITSIFDITFQMMTSSFLALANNTFSLIFSISKILSKCFDW